MLDIAKSALKEMKDDGGKILTLGLLTQALSDKKFAFITSK